jgi:phospholipid/cholesterol/gamma-HCH transport system substrate-binding protein
VSRVSAFVARRPATSGAIILAVCAFALYCVFTRGFPGLTGPSGRTLHAVFAHADDLRKGNPVRVHGLAVGEVTGIRLQPGSDTALVTARLTASHLRLTKATRATLRWGTLLGGSVYLDLDPGSPSAPAAHGDVIPLARTSSQVGFDELNGIYSGDTAHETQVMLAQFDRALSDPGAVGRAIDAVSPTLTTVDRGLTPLLGTHPGDMQALVANTAHVVHGLGRNPDALRALVANAARTLQVTADERNALGAMIRDFPPALDSLRTTSHRIDRTLQVLNPLAVRLEPGAKELDPATRAAAPAFAQTAALLDEAQPLLRDLAPSLRSLRLASRSGVELVAGLTPTLNRLHGDILPWLERSDPDTGQSTIDMIGPTAAATASAASEFDGTSNWLHFAPEGDERTFLDSSCQPFFTDPTASEQLRCQALNQVLAKLFGASAVAR